MMNRLTGLLALIAVAGIAVLVWAFQPNSTTPPEARFISDAVYCRIGGEEVKVDLAIPQGDGPFPAVVCLPGGGWTAGSRKHLTQTIQVLARRGFVAAAAEVRVAPKSPFPACLDDARAAVRWIASRPDVDPRRVGIMGLSSGGHLALLVAATDPRGVQAVAAFSAPVDLMSNAMHTPELLKRNLVPLLGGPPESIPDVYRRASPLAYDLKGMPPVFMAHGSDDKLVPIAHVRAFREKVNAAGGTAKLLVLEGEGHTWRGASLLKGIDEMLTFLDGALKK